MAYTDYEGKIHVVKYLPKGSVENEENLNFCGVGENKSMSYILYI